MRLDSGPNDDVLLFISGRVSASQAPLLVESFEMSMPPYPARSCAHSTSPTGHGGIDFYKFRETNVLWAKELADAVDFMWHAGRCAVCHSSPLSLHGQLMKTCPRSGFLFTPPLSSLPLHSFGRLLIIFETCHAESFLAHLKTPNVVAIATSGMDEDSVAVGWPEKFVATLHRCCLLLLLLIVSPHDCRVLARPQPRRRSASPQ